MTLDAAEVLTKGSKSILNPKYRYQLLVTLTIQLFTFAHGIATGWTSPTLHKLQSAADSPTTFTISVEQASWIGSLYGLGSLTGIILWGIMLNRIGRKWSMYLLALPHMCSWVLIFFSKTYVYLYIARFLAGVTGGANFLVVPIFISEIADPNIRGALSTMAMLFLSIGIMIGYVLSSYVDYYLNPCLVIVLPVLYLVLIVQFPETPQHLLRLQDVEQARKSFHFYKNLPKPDEAATDGGEATNEENVEFLELRKDFEHKSGSMEKLVVKDFVNRDALMGFCTAFVLIILNQFSGSYPFLNYMSDVFAHSGSDINPNTCTIVIGATQILGTCCATLLVDRFGRKVMMLISTGGLALCLFSFGMFMEFTTVEAKLHFNWVPLVIMTGAMMFISFGVIGLIFTVIVEVIPTKIRGIGTSIAMAMMSVLTFVSLKIFPAFLHGYGLGTLMFSCAGVCVISWFYLLKFQEETNGKSMNK